VGINNVGCLYNRFNISIFAMANSLNAGGVCVCAGEEAGSGAFK